MDIPRMGVPDELAARLSMAEQHEYLQQKFRPSRRSLLRGGAIAAGAGLAAPLAGGTASATLLTNKSVTVDGSLVAPFGRHLAYGADPRSQIRIGWQVPLAVKNPFIRVGTHPYDLGHKVKAEVRALTTTLSTGTTVQYYLHAGLDKLSPGRTYYYGVGHDGFDPANVHAVNTVASFTTAPQRGKRTGPWVFTAFGDQGVSYHALANDSVILGQNPVFHLHAGDIAYADPSGSGLTTDTYDPRTWDQFLAQTEAVASRVPWMVATGNHDMEAWYSEHGYAGQEARWDFPGNGPSNCPSVYSYIYGNVAVISLDANDVSYEIPANLGYSGGSQTAWLEKRLKFLRAQQDIDFIVVFFHHCAYSTTNQHASEGGVRKEWVPLFDSYKVDLVVNGHNHVYERTDPIKAGAPTKKAPIGATIDPSKDGTVYATAGGAGRSLYSFPVTDSYEGSVKDLDSVPSYSWTATGVQTKETVEWSRVRYTGYSFLAIEVTPAHRWGAATTLTVKALAEGGAEIDRFTVTRTAGLVSTATRGVAKAATDLSAS
jgi:hypothetical protein